MKLQILATEDNAIPIGSRLTGIIFDDTRRGIPDGTAVTTSEVIQVLDIKDRVTAMTSTGSVYDIEFVTP